MTRPRVGRGLVVFMVRRAVSAIGRYEPCRIHSNAMAYRSARRATGDPRHLRSASLDRVYGHEAVNRNRATLPRSRGRLNRAICEFARCIRSMANRQNPAATRANGASRLLTISYPFKRPRVNPYPQNPATAPPMDTSRTRRVHLGVTSFRRAHLDAPSLANPGRSSFAKRGVGDGH